MVRLKSLLIARVWPQVALAARAPQVSYIAAPAASWLDDFLAWISPQIARCCRAFPDGGRCPPPDQPPCNASAAACANCTACFRAGGPPGGDLLVGGRPSIEQVAHLRNVQNTRASLIPGVVLKVATFASQRRETVMGGRDVQQQALLSWFLEVLP